MAGVELWGRTTPRRGAKGEGPCRSRRIFEIAGTPRGRARRECFTVFHALPHPPPTFVLAPLPLGWGWGHSLHLPCRLPGKVCAPPVPQRADWVRVKGLIAAAAPCGHRDGALLPARCPRLQLGNPAGDLV